MKRLGKHLKARWLLGKLFLLIKKASHKEIIKLGKEALELFEELDLTYNIGVVTRDLSLAYSKIADYENALKYGERSLQVFYSFSSNKDLSIVYYSISVAHQRLGNYEEALSNSKKSLRLAKQVNNIEMQGWAFKAVGEALFSLGKYAEAIDYIDDSLNVCKLNASKNSQLDEIHAINSKSRCYQAIGDIKMAEKYYRQVLFKSRKLSYLTTEADALANLGSLFYEKESYEEAINHYYESLEISKKINNLSGICSDLLSLGNCYRDLKKEKETLEFYNQSLEIAKNIKSKHLIASGLYHVGVFYFKKGKLDKALYYTKASLNKIGRETNDPDLSIVYQLTALIFIEKKNYQKASANLYKSIIIAENTRINLGNNDDFKISLFESQVDYYRQLQDVLIKQGKIEEALEISERGRSRSLVEAMSLQLKNNDEKAGITPPDIEQIKKFAEWHQTTLINYSLDAKFSENSSKPIGFEIFIWVVSPNRKVTFHKTGILSFENWLADAVEKVSIVQKAEQMREAISSGKEINWGEKELADWYKLLIEPIEKYLPSNEEDLITFIPGSYLFSIPFAALVDRDRKFLIEKHTISVAPSIKTLELTDEYQKRIRESKKKEVLVVGNPDMPKVTWSLNEPPSKLSSLKYAEQEAIDIAKLFDTEPLIGTSATKHFVFSKLSEQRIIHLATHGLFNELDESKIPGSIALAPSEFDDGILTAEEIIKVKLNADLVVLSACNTGRGRVAADGIIGLARSFMVAGVPSVVVSLWSVSDAPTASLMINFYENFNRNGNKAKALRQAMLKTMKIHNSPRDWGGFLLIGEAD